MNAKVDIFMRFYVADYLADTTDLTTEEHGAYLLLLLNLWKRDGRLPCQPERLARMVGMTLDRWESVWMVIGRFFALDDGHITQARLRRELDAAKERSDDAKRAATKRWHGQGISGGNAEGHAEGMPSHMPSQCEPLCGNDASHKSVVRRSDPDPPIVPKGDGPSVSTGEPTYPAEFEAAWCAFPKRRGTKHDAYDRWRRLKPRPALDAVLTGIEAWKRSQDWRKDAGEFIPAMSVWLRKRAWESPPDPAPGQQRLSRVEAMNQRKLQELGLFGEPNA